MNDFNPRFIEATTINTHAMLVLNRVNAYLKQLPGTVKPMTEDVFLEVIYILRGNHNDSCGNKVAAVKYLREASRVEVSTPFILRGNEISRFLCERNLNEYPTTTRLGLKEVKNVVDFIEDNGM